MKFVKGISLFIIYPLFMLGIGFFAGVEAVCFFYPGSGANQTREAAPMGWADNGEAALAGQEKTGNEEISRTAGPPDGNGGINAAGRNGTGQKEAEGGGVSRQQGSADGEGTVQEASSAFETLSVDTEYVLEETDVLNQSVVVTVWKLPPKYVGMNREQFLVAMESYEAFPPLSERERGFVGLEVLSFSRERVVVQMNYRYLQPGEGFYLAVKDNELVVYQEDMQTVYINTGIMLDSLPDDIQIQIIQMLWMEDEESLYSFLEAYSS